MHKQISKSTSWSEQNKKNTIRLAIWTAAWTLSMALATFGPTFLWGDNTALTFAGIIINAAIGVGMIVANKNQIKGMDELQQKIHLEAMAMALGIGVVFGLSYSLLDITNIISFDAEIGHLVMLISLTYLVFLAKGRKSYQ